MAKWLKLYVIYPFYTSLTLPHLVKHKSDGVACSRHQCTLLNTKVLNFKVSKEKLEKLCQNFVVFPPI